MKSSKLLGDVLRQARDNCGLSQQAACRELQLLELDVGRDVIANIEGGRSPTKLINAVMLAVVCGRQKVECQIKLSAQARKRLTQKGLAQGKIVFEFELI